MKQFSRSIRSVVLATLGFAGTIGMIGCQSNTPAKTSTGVRGDVTDIRPVEPAAYQPPLYDTSAVIPVAPQPITIESPTLPSLKGTATVTTIMSTTPATGELAGTTHVVHRGETLFSIAKTAYGNGKQWRKIAAANPGVSAAKLRVGQKLILP